MEMISDQVPKLCVICV